jgi:hypothetical protein
MTQKAGFTGIIFDLNDAVQNVTEEEISKEAENLREPEEGEIEIGIVTDEVKRLDVLLSKVYEEAQPLIEQFEKIRENRPFFMNQETLDGLIELEKNLSEKKNMIELYDKIKWRSIRSSVENCPNSIGIRKGWKVVSVPEKKGSGIEIIGIGIGSDDLEFLRLMDKLG